MVLGMFRDKPGGPGRRQQTLTDSEDEAENDNRAGGGSKPLVGWVYVGSHNFTPSAWGTLSGSGFNPTLNVSARHGVDDDGHRRLMRPCRLYQITNYELGILLPLHSQEEADSVACWERPPQKYAIGRDGPWVRLSDFV